MSSRPWHKRYHGNALNGMRGLSLELRGAYTTILDLIYDHGGPIRLDERRLCGELGCDVRVFRRVLPDLVNAKKLRLWCDGETVWIVNDKANELLNETGFDASTCAGLSPNFREKFAIAIQQLLPKSGRKPNKNNGGSKKAVEEKGPRGRGRERTPIVPVGDGDENASPKPAKADPVLDAYEAWQDTAQRCGLPVAKALTDTRRRAIGKRLDDAGPEGWREALAAVEVSALCRGQRPGRDGQEPWRADLDFVCQPKSFTRLREGFYGRDAKAPAGEARRVAEVVYDGPPQLREWLVAATSEDFARSYVDNTVWLQAERSLVAPSQFHADKLRTECWEVLQRAKVSVVVAAKEPPAPPLARDAAA